MECLDVRGFAMKAVNIVNSAPPPDKYNQLPFSSLIFYKTVYSMIDIKFIFLIPNQLAILQWQAHAQIRLQGAEIGNIDCKNVS